MLKTPLGNNNANIKGEKKNTSVDKRKADAAKRKRDLTKVHEGVRK